MAEQEYFFVVEDSVKEDRDIHVGPGGRHGHRGGTPGDILQTEPSIWHPLIRQRQILRGGGADHIQGCGGTVSSQGSDTSPEEVPLAKLFHAPSHPPNQRYPG